MSDNAAWSARDLSVLWHPCTQMKDHEWLPMVPIRRGNGVWLEDFDGRRYIDAISSWWVNLFGHANPRINRALGAQAETLEHVLLAGFSHAPAIELAERLVAVTPPGLDRVFYADNGSSAVEVALKMSFHYWRNTGRGERTRFVSLANSYHGETLGALSVGDVALYKATYRPLLLDTLVAPTPDRYDAEPGESGAELARRRAADLRALLERHAGEVCAILIEPLVQCAGGMRMHDPEYLRQLRTLCDEPLKVTLPGPYILSRALWVPEVSSAAYASKEDLAEAMQGGDINYDVVIATPDAMRVVGKLGTVLGPRGLMPNPKVGTVSPDPAQAVRNAKAGQVRYRTDKAGIIHCTIGKASFEVDALKNNLTALLQDLVKAKPASAKGQYLQKISVSSTMGLGITVDQATLSL